MSVERSCCCSPGCDGTLTVAGCKTGEEGGKGKGELGSRFRFGVELWVW